MGLLISKDNKDTKLQNWEVGDAKSERFNITVASWPGVGSTTLALLLSYLYGMKYFYSGAVFRYFSEKLGYSSEGKEYNRSEYKYNDHLHNIVDDYSKLLLEKGGYVIGTKPLGYLINEPETYTIFLHADIEERAKRAVREGREGADTIKEGLLTRQKAAGEDY